MIWIDLTSVQVDGSCTALSHSSSNCYLICSSEQEICDIFCSHLCFKESKLWLKMHLRLDKVQADTVAVFYRGEWDHQEWFNSWAQWCSSQKKKYPTDPKKLALKEQNDCRPSLFSDPYCSVEMSSKDDTANVKTGNMSLLTASTTWSGLSECRLPNRNGVGTGVISKLKQITERWAEQREECPRDVSDTGADI